MFNTGARRPAGALYRARLVFVVLLAASLGVASLTPGSVRAEAPVCQIPDLMLFVAQQGATMHVVGGFTLRNVGAQPCLIPPITRIEPLDSDGTVVPLIQIYDGLDPAKSVLLPQGQEVGIEFTYPSTRELCPPQSFRMVSALRLSASNAGHEYIFQISFDAPRRICDAPDAGMSIGPFWKVGPPQPNEVLMRLPLTGTGGSADRLAMPAGVLFTLSGLLAAIGLVLTERSRSRLRRDRRTPCAPTTSR